MIQHLNRYNLDRPEEQKKVEVNESVIDIVKSTYDIWLQYHRRSLSIDTLRSSLLAFDKAHGEQLYEEAVALLSPHSKEFTNVGQRDLEIILSTVKDSDTEVSGLYLSAMLNSTDLEELDGVFNFTFLGYKLAADKKLIVREGSNVLYLGTLSQGLLINYGNAEHIALHAIGGLHVNFGKVYSMASGATGGVQVNLGKANHLGEGAKGGVQLSYSTNLQDKPISDGYILNDIDLARGYAIDLITKALEPRNVKLNTPSNSSKSVEFNMADK